VCPSCSFRTKNRCGTITLPLLVRNPLCTNLFIYGLFNNPVSVSGYIPFDGRIINTLWPGKCVECIDPGLISGTTLDVPRGTDETTKLLRCGSRRPSQVVKDTFR